MKVKIEFEVNAPTSKLLKCLYDRLDILHNDLINMDSNFKDIDVAIITHHNNYGADRERIKLFLNSFYGKTAMDVLGGFCPMYHNGTCWGTKDKEKCTCGGIKSYCTYNPKGE